MTETKHSPTPWATMEVAHSGATAVMDAEGNAVAHCATGKGNGEVNAELIVLAVSSYDKLVEACRAIVFATEVEDPAMSAVAATLARAALALAEPTKKEQTDD